MNEFKVKLRKKLLFIRENFSREYIEKSDELIYQKLINLEAYKNSKNIFCYISIEGEVSTIKFLKKVLLDNKRLFVPLCLEKGVMEAREIKKLDDLVSGKFGILEPLKSSFKIDINDIDFSVVPCVTANKNGYRLGYGGGYYDRFYDKKSTKNSFILCRKNIIYDDIPIDNHDIRFENVMTEEGLLN